MADWSIPVAKLAERARLSLDDAVRALTLFAFSRVVELSPVDTGRFRANWVVSYGRIDTTVTSSTEDPTGRVASAVVSLPTGGTVFIANSLPYASVIEFGGYPNPPKYGSKKRGESAARIHVVNGYSEQAPQGIVRLTGRETMNRAAEIVRSVARARNS